MNAMKNIESKINQLTPGMIEELDRYLDYLINKTVVRKSRKLKQDWAGGLKDIKLTSIELQKKAATDPNKYDSGLWARPSEGSMLNYIPTSSMQLIMNSG